MRRDTPTFRRLAIVLTAAIAALGFAAPVPAPAALAGGNQLWTASYHGQQSGEAGATAEAVSPGGRMVFVTGFTGYTAQDGSTGWATLAYNTATGARGWLRTYRGSDTSPTAVDGATSIAVSPDGSTVFGAASSPTLAACPRSRPSPTAQPPGSRCGPGSTPETAPTAR